MLGVKEALCVVGSVSSVGGRKFTSFRVDRVRLFWSQAGAARAEFGICCVGWVIGLSAKVRLSSRWLPTVEDFKLHGQKPKGTLRGVP